jgi:predicted dehydrogenase
MGEGTGVTPGVTRRIALVGLGNVSRLHVDALERIAGLNVEAGVDIADGVRLAFLHRSLPVYRTVQELFQKHQVDDIIIATPTSTHAKLCSQLFDLDGTPRILVEKPLATELDEVRRLLERAERSGRALDVLYHFRHAPEVLWAVERLNDVVAEHGPVTEFQSFFADPYARLEPGERDAYVSSWIDSGINALSLLDRLISIRKVESLRSVPGTSSSFEAQVSFVSDGREAIGHLLTTWEVGAGSKWTRLSLASGAELVLDHTATLGRLIVRGATVEIHGWDGALTRGAARYVNLFTEVFSPGYQADVRLHKRLHALLLQRVEAVTPI